MLGVTTDGSPLYPEPLAEIFNGVPHQVCEFHILKEINREILKALTQVRRQLKEWLPKLKRGRPSSQAADKAAHRKEKLQDKISDLFEHRYLFVKHCLTSGEKKILLHITRGLRNLRNLRSIMNQVYLLFDRRCRTETALEKLAKLRCRVRRFKTLWQTLRKLFTPNIEKALIFLDDSLLPSTSNAVERGYRRHRKMQKGIYRVRTQKHQRGRPREYGKKLKLAELFDSKAKCYAFQTIEANCWLRTFSSNTPSEFVTRIALANLLKNNLHGFAKDWITQLIQKKQKPCKNNAPNKEAA
ncbi:MAG: hypothetical protein ABIG61_14260 [Planctomycetota bacterium]